MRIPESNRMGRLQPLEIFLQVIQKKGTCIRQGQACEAAILHPCYVIWALPLQQQLSCRPESTKLAESILHPIPLPSPERFRMKISGLVWLQSKWLAKISHYQLLCTLQAPRPIPNRLIAKRMSPFCRKPSPKCRHIYYVGALFTT